MIKTSVLVVLWIKSLNSRRWRPINESTDWPKRTTPICTVKKWMSKLRRMSAADALLGRERKKEWCVTVESSYQPNIDTFPLSFYHVTLDNESLSAWYKMMILWHLHFRAHLVQQLYYLLLVDREGKQKIIMLFMKSLYYSPFEKHQ